jgi:hypothetical protein
MAGSDFSPLHGNPAANGNYLLPSTSFFLKVDKILIYPRFLAIFASIPSIYGDRKLEGLANNIRKAFCIILVSKFRQNFLHHGDMHNAHANEYISVSPCAGRLIYFHGVGNCCAQSVVGCLATP